MKRLLIIALLAVCFAQPLFARVEWSAAATDAIIGAPAIASDRAIFATYDGRVYSYSLKTGAILWTFDSGKFLTQGVQLVSPDKASVVTIEGTVFIISTVEGKVLSETSLGKKPLSFYAADGRAYVGYEGGISAVSSVGRVIWNYNLSASPGQIGGGSGRIYFTAGRQLYCIVGQSGALRWKSNAEDSFLARPIEIGGKVYVGATDGRLYEFDAVGGLQEWNFKTGAWVMSTPSLVGNALFFGSNDGNAYSITKYGQLRFRTPVEGEVWAQPLSYDQNGRTIIVFATTSNKLYGIDSQTGKSDWVFQTYGRPEEAALVGKSLVFGTNKGKVYSVATSEICGFTWPTDMQMVGDWPIEVEGKANADGGVDRVEVRAGNGPWMAANGKEDWYATMDLSGLEPGAVTLECRTRGRLQSTAELDEFSSLTLIKSKNAQPMTMYVSAPGEAEPDENVTISVQDTRGMDIRNISITVEQSRQALDSPFAAILGRSGPVAITLEKPGYKTATVVIIGKGSSTDVVLVILGIVAVAAIGYIVIGRKLLSDRGKQKK